MMKSKSACVIFKEHLKITQELWGDVFWEDMNFDRMVGDKVKADLIRNHL
jgi:hypothetical protein